MQPITLPDITTTGSAVQVATVGYAKWIQFTALTHDARVGDSNVGSARGASCPSETPVIWPVDTNQGELYSLADIYAYLPSGATLTVTYGA
jgi:hypothetical protein